MVWTSSGPSVKAYGIGGPSSRGAVVRSARARRTEVSMVRSPCSRTRVSASASIRSSGGSSPAVYPSVRTASSSTPFVVRVTRTVAMAGRSGVPTTINCEGSGARSRARSVNCLGDQGRLTGSAVPQPAGAVPVNAFQAASRPPPSRRCSSARCTVRRATINCRPGTSPSAGPPWEPFAVPSAVPSTLPCAGTSAGAGAVPRTPRVNAAATAAVPSSASAGENAPSCQRSTAPDSPS